VAVKRLACVFVVLLVASPAAAGGPWRLSVAADEAMLTRADGSGEDAATSLHCTPKSGAVGVTLFLDHRLADHLMGDQWVDKAGARAPWKIALTVTSGAVATSGPALANPDEMNGGSEIEATIPANAPVMIEFAKTGALRLIARGETVRDPPIPKAKAAALVAACAK
jgi:hypothetical protein